MVGHHHRPAMAVLDRCSARSAQLLPKQVRREFMEVQRIKYERTGGFAGMRFHADFEPGDLPEEQSRPLLELLDKMDFDELPEDLTGNPAHPDQFTYIITVKTDEGEHTVVVGD